MSEDPLLVEANTIRKRIDAVEHSCGGWYWAIPDDEGFHRQPSGCATCYSTAAEALDAGRAAFDPEDYIDYLRVSE